MKKIIFATLLYATSGILIAGEQVGNVVDIRVSDTQILNPTHIKLDGERSGRPACATTTFWQIDTNTTFGKNILSAALTAFSAGKPVHIWGSGSCTMRTDMEDILQISISH